LTNVVAIARLEEKEKETILVFYLKYSAYLHDDFTILSFGEVLERLSDYKFLIVFES